MPETPQGFQRVGEIIFEANSIVLNPLKEKLDSSDVKRYLEQLSEADKVLAEGPNSLPRWGENWERTKRILGNWEIDRSEALLLLLEKMANAAYNNRQGTLRATASCARVLIEEPLIPSKDFGKYETIVSVSGKALGNVKSKGNKDQVKVFKAYLAGVMHNADLFCPRIFREEVGENDIRESKKAFEDALLRLQE